MEDRPNFDEYFLDIARTVSARSEDVFIQHGAVLVDYDMHIIGTGYNGFVTGFDKSLVDVYNRDERRPYMVHAEQNALLNSVLRPNRATMYITGEPCVNCMLSMINFGVDRIFYIEGVGTITDDESTRAIKKNLFKSSDVEIWRYMGILDGFKAGLR
jgi:dCMP deaminase